MFASIKLTYKSGMKQETYYQSYINKKIYNGILWTTLHTQIRQLKWHCLIPWKMNEMKITSGSHTRPARRAIKLVEKA